MPALAAPTGVRAEVDRDGVITLRWTAPDRRDGETHGPYRYEWSRDQGRTSTPTATAATSVRIAGLDPGTYRFRVRARDSAGPGDWSVDSVAVVIPETLIVAASTLVVGQWTGAARLRAIIDMAVDLVRDEIEKPLLDLRRQRRIETAEGVWLDAIARRLGLDRPYTTFGADDPRFGFDDAGVPFDLAPFRGESANDATVPLADVVFRRLVRARAITVLSDGSLQAFRRAVAAVDPAATVRDSRDMTVTVTTDVRWQIELAERQQALPRVAGVLLRFRDRQRFGFDEAGVPFDQGAFAPDRIGDQPAPDPDPGPTPSRYSVTRTLDRTFAGDTPASGGGDVAADTFVHEGQTWEIWQVVPFLGVGVSPVEVGDCRVHLRNRAIDRDAMMLADMPSTVTISAVGGQTADWTGLPWTFTRPTDAGKFTSPGSGNAARRSIDYEPAHAVADNAVAAGIAQGETFTITLEF